MDSKPVQRTIPFRLLAGSGLLIILVLTLMDYLEEAHRVLEIQSVEQQKRVINSALVVVFSTYAVEGRLHELQQLDGANPFVFLKEYGLGAGQFLGETQPGDELATGWYYEPEAGEIFFKPLYLDRMPAFRVVFYYIDNNGNNRFDQHIDAVRSLSLEELGWL